MSAVLLDTHVLVWLLSGSKQLGSKARGMIQKAAAQDSLFVSAITPWEIAMLVSKGRLTMDRDVGEWLQVALSLPGIRLEPLRPEIAVASTRLPWEAHPDPADRMIVATARHLGAALLTEDQQLLGYARQGHLKARQASL